MICGRQLPQGQQTVPSSVRSTFVPGPSFSPPLAESAGLQTSTSWLSSRAEIRSTRPDELETYSSKHVRAGMNSSLIKMVYWVDCAHTQMQISEHDIFWKRQNPTYWNDSVLMFVTMTLLYLQWFQLLSCIVGNTGAMFSKSVHTGPAIYSVSTVGLIMDTWTEISSFDFTHYSSHTKPVGLHYP